MIEDPPLLTIKRRFERPAAEIISAFAGVPVSQVVDAMGGRGALHYAIKPLSPATATMVGVAVTCHCGPADNLALFGALDAAASGDVIVAATDSFAGTAVTGDLVLGMARNKGVAGFITDGLVRDVVGIEAVGLPVYCAGIIANSPARNGPGTVGFPVVVGGVTISPGDILVGDRDGLAVVPRLEAETVLARLSAIRAAEKTLDGLVRQGLEMPDFAKVVLKSNRARFVD
ncbi:aldolase [Mesorhizobium sp. LSJC268A00]|uniref:RraA family protein n=1 Tax=unclassified Mesorhizobium TaxID=325217 RepID=UPI0003CE28F0|nr:MULTISPECIES: aldolase [unclassified Mesorhizobium]ESW84293.1 aldolase [Mesorhizobium sp. LSJC269B00]ESX01621.1 aldolase [Mesorhizobium sp. LSJC268A00]ESX09275.1 aldolase [Mesorhizobium sp. LSJC265A00]ESX91431.1 aldolase [Mesorhizobium sp. LNJC403B00]ESZ07792.1 aldolase [Mesorhizobium sp. L2C089B000]